MSPAKSAQFGPRAVEVKVTPRSGESLSRSGIATIQKPHTGMTIQLTPELLTRLQQPGPRPEIELVLRSAGEGQFDFTTHLYLYSYRYKRATASAYLVPDTCERPSKFHRSFKF